MKPTPDTSTEYRKSALSRNTSVHIPLAVVGSAMVFILWLFAQRINANEMKAEAASWKSQRAVEKVTDQSASVNDALSEINGRLKNIESRLMGQR